MTVSEILAQLDARHVRLALKGDELVVRGSRQSLKDSALLDLLRNHKQALVELIRRGAYGHSQDDDVPPNRIPACCEHITPEMLPLVQLSAAEIERLVATVPGGAANVQDIYPLAPLQEGMLFHHLLQTEGDVFLTSELLRFDGRSRLEPFLQALQRLVERHDILRTSVHWEGLPEPVQVVWRRASMTVEEIRLDPAAGEMASQLLARFNPRHFRIDLHQAPLMHAYIAHEPHTAKWLLLILGHHLTFDAVAWDRRRREIQAFLSGQNEPLPASHPFRNFVARTRRDGDRAQHEAFFRSMLGDVSEPTAPLGVTGVQGKAAGLEGTLTLDESLCARLRAQARKLGVVVATLGHLACALVVARLCGRDDVVFGTVLLGRTHGGESIEQAMGLFVNTLPLRVRVGEESAIDSVGRMHALLAGLLRHEHASLATVQRCSAVAAPAPLFTALFNYRHAARFEHLPGDTRGVWEGIEFLHAEGHTNYPITLCVDDFGEHLVVSAEVHASIDPDRICRFMQQALQGLVDTLERAPHRPLHGIDVLPPTERERVLEQWNATYSPSSHERLVHEGFEARTRRQPHALALVDEDRQLSYGELNARANRLAHYLRKLGVRPDDRVAVCVERSLEMVVGVLAIAKAGGAYLPLDPSYPQERLLEMLTDSVPRVLLIGGALSAGLRDRLRTYVKDQGSSSPSRGAPASHALTLIDLDSDAQLWSGEPTTDPVPDAVALTTDHLAYVLYTSGSTGKPKGVALSHRALVNLLQWQSDCPDGQRQLHTLQYASLSFDASFQELFSTLRVGGSIELIRTELRRDFPALFRRICARRVERLYLPYVALQRLAEAAVGVDGLLAWHGGNCPLREILTAGEQLRVTEQIRRLFEQLPQCRLHNYYGPTETHVTTALALSESPEHWAPLPSIGGPIANSQIYILDRHGQPAPIGVAGEVYIAGIQLARGYWQRPALTAERFVVNPFGPEPGARMYKTGDVGRFKVNGEIEFLGRNDDQVKIRGYRIEPGEIEVRLTQHPAIREAVVVAREDEPGEKRLVAYYTRVKAADPAPVREHGNRSHDGDWVDGESLDTASLRQYVAAVLPEYMVPAAYVELAALPLTPSGKLDRKVLPAPGGTAHVHRTYEAPIGQIESTVAGIWAEVLKLERVSRNDHFFELGGHSLLAVRVLSRLHHALHVTIGVGELFTHPVLKDLAQILRHAARSELPPIMAVDRNEPLPLSFPQRRLWFLSQLPGVSQAYHVPMGLRLSGELDCGALRRALDTILQRHEALRTCFVMMDGEPVQRIAPVAPGFVLHEQSLGERVRDPVEVQRQVDRLTQQEATEPFDLEHGPLIRGRLLKLSERDHVLLITMHHIVADGWSIGVLVNELSALYRAYRAGEQDPLPVLAIQYADYAVWQRRWLAGALMQEQMDYWRATLSAVPTMLGLPCDRPRPARQDYAGASVDFACDLQLMNALRAFSSRHEATMFMVVLAAWAIVLRRLSSQEDVVIGAPVANRTRAELEPLIGFFVNTLALRVDLSGNPTVIELLHRVKSRVLAAQQHQELPFEQVVEIINPARNLAHSPLFQAMLAWQNNEAGELDLPGLKLAPIGSQHVVAKFDLTLNLYDTGDRLGGHLEYATALFDRDTIERHADYLRRVLQAMTENDELSIEHLSLLGTEERRKLLIQWNATTCHPADHCIHELFARQVALRGDAIALVHEGRELTYAELNTRANQFAHHLRTLGVQPEGRVALCVERGIEMVVALLGILKAGAAYVPVDPAYPAERLQFMLQDSGARWVVTQSGFLERLALHADQHVVLLDEWLTDARYPTHNVPAYFAGVSARNLAYVIYTSGSSGVPKAVMIEHAQVVRLFLASASYFDFSERDVWTLFHSIAFDFSVWEIWGALLHGARLVIVGDQISRNAADFYELVCTAGVTVLNQTPSAFRALVSAQDRSALLHRLRWTFFGGEVLDLGILSDWCSRSQNRLTQLVNMYGITETTVHVTVHPLQDSQEAQGSGTTATGDAGSPIGRALNDLKLYILDEHGEPVPIGVAGEIYAGGAGLARGYLGRASLTAERFLPDPFSAEPGARIYRSGDLGRYRAGGSLVYLGRNDTQVKIRGHRIELGEIEAHLREHPAVTDAVVVVREDQAAEKRLVAYYLAASSNAVSAEMLLGHLSSRLPQYMVPAACMRLEALPLTVNGKLDRKALPAPDGSAFLRREYAEPAGELEHTLARIWRELLNIERVGRHDHFFELGGHSLLAMRAVTLLSQVNIAATVVAFFNYPTIASLAEHLAQSCADTGVKGVIPIRAGGGQRPLFLVHEFYGFDTDFAAIAGHLDADIPVYGLQAVPLDEPQLQTMLELAGRLVSLIRTVQPTGPYRVAGWSFGGALAYEVAQQLIAQEQIVEFVGLLDTYGPGWWHSPSTAERCLVALCSHKTSLDARQRARLDSMANSLSFETLLQQCREGSLLPEYFRDRADAQIRQQVARLQAHAHALDHYEARPISIPIHLFVAGDRTSFDDPPPADPLLGWGRLLPARQIRRISVPGGHHSMLASPHVELLGKMLSNAMSVAY